MGLIIIVTRKTVPLVQCRLIKVDGSTRSTGVDNCSDAPLIGPRRYCARSSLRSTRRSPHTTDGHDSTTARGNNSPTTDSRSFIEYSHDSISNHTMTVQFPTSHVPDYYTARRFASENYACIHTLFNFIRHVIILQDLKLHTFFSFYLTNMHISLNLSDTLFCF